MQQKREPRGPGEQQPGKAKLMLPGRRCSRRRPQRLPEEPREREPAAARGLATEVAAAQAAGWASGARRGTARRRGLDDCAGRDAQTKGAALAARGARRMPARLCDCRRCRVGWGDARQRRAHPPAGGFRGHGGGAPHESARRWRPQRRWLRRPQAQRSAAQRLPIERPLPPLWDTLFLLGPEGARGGRGERAQRAAGEGGAGRHRRARIKARP